MAAPAMLPLNQGFVGPMEPTYEQLYLYLRVSGMVTPSRMGDTYEALGEPVTWVPGLIPPRSGLNLGLGFMELMQGLAGVFDPEQIKRVAPKAQHELFTEQMAYGPRLAPAVPGLLAKLRDDPQTRQAVAFIGARADGPSDNLPCTLTMQFLQREGRLNLITSMRSWDISRGLPYDMMFQGGYLMALARCLGVEPGWCCCMAGSLHLYADQAHKLPGGAERRFRLDDSVPTGWAELQEWAYDQIWEVQRIPAGVVVEDA
jgi:hypothetical protein